MPRLLAVPMLLVAFSIAPPAIAQSANDAAGRVVEVEVPAPALTGNLLGTPSVQGAAS